MRDRLWLKILAGFGGALLLIGVGAAVSLTKSDQRPSADAVSQSPEALNYSCSDERALDRLRKTSRGKPDWEWIGDVGIWLPPDAAGHTVTVLGGRVNGDVKMAVSVRDGTKFETITMDGADAASGERLKFDYDGSGYALGPKTYSRRGPERVLYGAVEVPRLGVYRLSYAIDDVDQGSIVLAFCRTEGQSYP